MNLDSKLDAKLDIGRSLTGSLPGVSEEMKLCIELCQNTYQTCEKVMSYCLEKGGEYAEPTQIQLMMACADMCKTAAHLMLWNSNYHNRLCGICAQLCDACAHACKRFTDDEIMQNCSRLCQICADTCKKMAEL